MIRPGTFWGVKKKQKLLREQNLARSVPQTVPGSGLNFLRGKKEKKKGALNVFSRHSERCLRQRRDAWVMLHWNKRHSLDKGLPRFEWVSNRRVKSTNRSPPTAKNPGERENSPTDHPIWLIAVCVGVLCACVVCVWERERQKISQEPFITRLLCRRPTLIRRINHRADKQHVVSVW